jgi:H+/Cl- antiporter ClcA
VASTRSSPAAAAPAGEAAARPRTPPIALLVLTAAVGVVVSLAAWGFLQLVHQVQRFAYTDLPGDLGYAAAPTWWPLPVLAVAGTVTAFAIVRLPGRGGHNPAAGLNAGATQPKELPGVLLAALATIALGAVLGPEAPLIALGSGMGIAAVRLVRPHAPPQVVAIVAATGGFAAISFIFGSPLIGAVILIEAAALDRRGLQVVLPLGLLASGIGSLVSIGMGSWTGLSSRDFAIGAVSIPAFSRPDLSDFAWTVPLAVAIALVTIAILWGARALQPLLMRRPFALIPAAGVVVAVLAIAFGQATGKGSGEVLFSGQDALPGLVSGASGWTAWALVALIAFKCLAWSVSLAGFRGGPTFPGLYLGAAAGILASHLPGLTLSPAIAVGMGAAMVSVLRLPLASVVLATLLTFKAGPGATPLVIVGVVVAFLVTLGLSPQRTEDR